MEKMRFIVWWILLVTVFHGCEFRTDGSNRDQAIQDSIRAEQHAREKREAAIEHERTRPRTKNDIQLSKDLEYDLYTLEDQYEYEGNERSFQWEIIRKKLALVENLNRGSYQYAVLQNYRNMNGEAPVVKNFIRNDYTRVSDSLGTERYQSAPLFSEGERDRPTIYGRDGSLVHLRSSDTLDFIKIEGLSFDGTWEVPQRYVKTIKDDILFKFVIFVDVTSQNISALKRSDKDDTWVILSMNPATTGVHQPPYAHETPLGMFVIQEQKEKMYYLKDGSRTEIAGFAPWASRFSNGGYIHGVPVNYPQKSIIEYGWSLGTVPRSHMCVRNASSHAKFIYEKATPFESLLFVID